MRQAKISQRKRGDWMIDFGVIDGRRRQFTAKSRVLAVAKAKEKESILLKAGINAIDLTAAQLSEASHVFRAMKESYNDVSLTELFEYFRSRHFPDNRPVRVVYDEYLKSQADKGLRPSSLASCRNVLSPFVAYFSKHQIDEMDTNTVDKWIRERGFRSAVTKTNMINYLSGFFSFAIKRSYIYSNPITNVERPRLKTKMPKFMAVDDVSKMFAAAECVCPEIVLTMALGFFAGIRSEELHRMDRASIRMEDGIITVGPDIAKTGHVRHISMSENLKAWIVAYMPEDQWKITEGRRVFTRQRKEVQAAAGVDEWPHNAMRHTFATMHVSYHQNAALTATELGHHSQDLLYRHYRGLATKEEASQYWGISPKATGDE